jgi:hypothetical protein
MRDPSPSAAAQDDIAPYFNPLHSHFPPSGIRSQSRATRGDEVERFSEGRASGLDALCWQQEASVRRIWLLFTSSLSLAPLVTEQL